MKQSRKNHSPSFKAKVTLEALREEESTAELFIAPPVDAQQLARLVRKLRESYNGDLIEWAGSEVGTQMRVFLRTPVALKTALSQMPEVAQVREITEEKRRKGRDTRDSASRNGHAAETRPTLRLNIVLASNAQQ